MKSLSDDKSATGKEIRNILKQADDDLIADIWRTGASTREIRQACSWLDNDDTREILLEKCMTGKVREVYEILLSRQDLEER